MRVTQRSMYNSMLGDMQSTLSAYMESVTQGSSQKRLNRPSDDPAGAARVLSYRGSLTQTNQHVTNAGTANGWLGTADSTLLSAQNLLAQIRVKAQEGATDTYDADQRMAMAKEVRELMGALMNLANNKHEDKYIFSGENTKTAPYQEGLTTTVHKGTSTGEPMQVTGSLSRTAMVRFAGDGQVPSQVPPSPPAPPGTPAPDMDYSWSEDGGKTWKQGTIPGGQNYFDVGSARVTVPAGSSLDVKQGYNAGTVPLNPMELDTGSTIDVRPTMIYQGSDNNAVPTVTPYGPIDFPAGTKFNATGKFANDTLVRFDADASQVAAGGTAKDVPYSYSIDGGATWITGNKATLQPGSSGTRLVLPGGFVDVNLAPGASISKDTQLSVKPQRTNLEFEILENQYISVNNIGKDIFGGLFTPKGSNNLQAATGKENGNNMFETVGKLVAALENNDRTAVGKCFDEIQESEKNVLYHTADIGGKMNRISTTLDVLEDHKIDQRTRLSAIEDIDFTELMTNLSQQQTAYQTVLKSSSMIMQLNLMKFM